MGFMRSPQRSHSRESIRARQNPRPRNSCGVLGLHFGYIVGAPELERFRLRDLGGWLWQDLFSDFRVGCEDAMKADLMLTWQWNDPRKAPKQLKRRKKNVRPISSPMMELDLDEVSAFSRNLGICGG